MGRVTTISWTNSTWNPWQGCRKISPGCQNCYAEALAKRRGTDFSVIRPTKGFAFNIPLQLQRRVDRGELPKGHMVFTCSMSDFFIQQADPWRQAAWATMMHCPGLTFQILTKRPGRMAWWANTVLPSQGLKWPDHIWAGTSVESAKYLPRLSVLARVPAKVRFVSFEPLLETGYMDIDPYAFTCVCGQAPCVCTGLSFQWAIIGGESGPGHRSMEMDTMLSLVGQCRHLGIAVFVKQDSGRFPGLRGRISDALWEMKEIPGQPKQ